MSDEDSSGSFLSSAGDDVEVDNDDILAYDDFKDDIILDKRRRSSTFSHRASRKLSQISLN
eukprot:CAMPEP_0114685942 /NCGR_PEP_ID=MMETSP0191-20121206/60989_1 /TAXON_ID=126664 /ORGANISM="Sorites sp." /LENGTH=60 /DNA_ID=CAMNT_0001970943 /DNA_START=10 /DNA_END=189 /DNA_ORIENTATION=-